MTAIVKDVMSTHVAAVLKHATFKDIAFVLREQRVSAFPVVDDDNRVIGVVSEADLLTKEALQDVAPSVFGGMARHQDQTKAEAVSAVDLMTSPAVTVGPYETVAHAAQLMYSRHVKRLPVVSQDGTLIGIITRSDILAVYDRDDADIREEIIRKVILEKFSCDPDQFRLTVANGIVTIAGTPETAMVGHEIVADARHVEGVVAVRDRLTYPPAADDDAAPGDEEP
jgi:CBS-domain-containing membrane protein